MQLTSELLFKPFISFRRSLSLFLEFTINTQVTHIPPYSLQTLFIMSLKIYTSTSKHFKAFESVPLCYLILWTAILDICVEEGFVHPPLQQLSGKFWHLLHSKGLFRFLLILVLICLLAVTTFNLSPNQFFPIIHWLYTHVPFVNDHQPQKLCLCSLQFASHLLIVLWLGPGNYCTLEDPHGNWNMNIPKITSMQKRLSCS